MNDKRTIVLCLILILLVVVVLYRWETSWWETDVSPAYAILYQQDRITSLIHYNAFLGEGEYVSGYQNPYITHGLTAFLYIAMGVTVIALLKHTNREK